MDRDDEVRVSVGSGDCVVGRAGNHTAAEQSDGNEPRTDGNGDPGGCEPPDAAPHLEEREANHQLLTETGVVLDSGAETDSRVRSASRPARTDSGVGSWISPAMRPSAMRMTRSA